MGISPMNDSQFHDKPFDADRGRSAREVSPLYLHIRSVREHDENDIPSLTEAALRHTGLGGLCEPKRAGRILTREHQLLESGMERTTASGRSASTRSYQSFICGSCCKGIPSAGGTKFLRRPWRGRQLDGRQQAPGIGAGYPDKVSSATPANH